MRWIIIAVADIKLTNASVNSGTAVLCGGATVDYDWKNITKDNAVPGKFDIAEATFNGFQPPVIAIRGTIPIDDAITNHMTQKLLVDFAAVRTGDTTLSVTAGTAGGTVLGGRPSGGYKTDGTNTLSSTIKIQIKTFHIKFSAAETKEGSGWSYTITMVETQWREYTYKGYFKLERNYLVVALVLVL